MSTSYASVVMVEDDEDDSLLLSFAWHELNLPNPLVIVKEGESMLEYLGSAVPNQKNSQPGLIILDWHLPRLTGSKLLSLVHDNPHFNGIPVLIMTGNQPPPEAEIQGWGPGRLVAWQPKATSYNELLLVLKNLWQRYFGAEDGGPTEPLQELDRQGERPLSGRTAT